MRNINIVETQLKCHFETKKKVTEANVLQSFKSVELV